MTFDEDPLRKALKDTRSMAEALRASGGFDNLADLSGQKAGALQQLQDAMHGAGLLDRIARGQRSVADFFAQHPTLQVEIERAQAALQGPAYSDLASSARGSAFDDAVASITRLGGGLSDASAFAQLIGGRSQIPDPVADAIARVGGMTPFIERLTTGASLEEAYRLELNGLARVVAEAAGALPPRAVIATQFPELVPEWRLPTAAEIAAVDLAAASGLRSPGREWVTATTKQMLALEQPWVRADRPERSLEGFAAFKGLTEIVARTAPAAARSAQLVRAELGDYRREDEADEAIDDVVLATGLRVGRGFDLRLSSLPMALVGSVFAPFGMTVGAAPEADPEELDTLIAQMFRQLERKLRAFIDRTMRAAVGENWIRQRVHRDVREHWAALRQGDIDLGRKPGDLFDYADFGEYRKIIEQGDNWRDAFQAVFTVKTAIGETLGRLGVIRNPVAHVRPLTVEDLLVLRVEGRRLYVWMGEPVP